VFHRTSPDQPTLPQQLPLTRPDWAVAIQWVAIALALAALGLSGHWQGMPVWAVVLVATLSLLVQQVVQQRQGAWLQDHFLCFKQSPSKFATAPLSFFGTFSSMTGQTSLTPVTLQQYWTHTFGLTLRLNLHNHPHNQPEVVTVTLWRNQLCTHTYRRLNIWAQWQAARCTPLSKGEPRE
jgi:hypothetical protein